VWQKAMTLIGQSISYLLAFTNTIIALLACDCCINTIFHHVNKTRLKMINQKENN